MADESNNDDIILSISADVASLRRAQKRMEETMNAIGRSSDKTLSQMAKTADQNFRQIEESAKRLRSKLDASFNKPLGSGINKGLAAVGSVVGLNELRKLTDTWTDLTSRVDLAAGSTREGTQVMDRLGQMARRTYSDLTQTAESYLSNSTALRDLGYSTNQSLDYTEALNNALVVSGAKGERAARVIDALAKAMAVGKLSGDNLNTVIEVGGRAAEALAAGLGTTVSGLRALGSQGKITGNDIVKSLTSQMAVLRKEAEDMPATIGDGFTLLNNALLQYVGNVDNVTTASSTMSQALILIADNFDKVADAGMQVAAVFAGAIIGRSLGGLVRTLGSTTAAVVKFTQAMKAAQSAGQMASALGGLGAAAGPLGAIIGGALVLAVGNYTLKAMEAKQNSDQLRAEMERLGLVAPQTAEGIDQAAEALDKLTDAAKARKLKNIADELERLRKGGVNWLGTAFSQGDELDTIAALVKRPLENVMQNARMSEPNREARREILNVISEFQEFQITAEKARERLEAINNTPVSDAVVELNKRVLDTITHMGGLQAMSTRVGEMPELTVATQNVQDLADHLDVLATKGEISPQLKSDTQDIIDKFNKAEISAEDAVRSINGLSQANPDMSQFFAKMAQAITVLGNVRSVAAAALQTMREAYPLGPDENKASRATADPYILQRKAENEAAAEYERNALRKAQLGKDQFALENKIAEVRKRSESENAKLTAEQIKRIAEAELAGDRSRSAEGKKPKKEKKTPDDKFDGDLQSITDRTSALIAETEAQRQINPLIDDYGYAVERARTEQELLNAAQKAGVEVTPALRAEIAATAEQWALATVEANQLSEAQAKIQQKSEEWRSTELGAFKGLVSDLASGKNAAEAFADALGKVLDKLLDILSQSLFDDIFGTSGSLLGGLLGRKDGGPIPGYASGGRVRGPGGPRDDKVLMWGSNGEFMMNANATQKFLPILEAMNAGRLPEFSNGGKIAIPAPITPRASIPVPVIPSAAQLVAGSSNTDNSRTDNSVNSSPVINVNVSGATGNAEVANMVQQGVAQGIKAWSQSSNFTLSVTHGVREAKKRGMRF
ncbi:tape measure protein [Brucella pseudogrignonensis]|uniref:tape measure protein n=1 Tax=Brucella pseudogrignonensis TaxID=419475 RepID=UPI003D97CEC2